MKILVVGNGGREHALGWKLKQSPKVEKLYFSPGNAGTALLGENIEINNSDHPAMVAWIKSNGVDLVVIGPDQYLAEGLTDSLQRESIRVFGPTRAAAEMEWSKSFAKQFMVEEGIPTARFESFTDMSEAMAYVRTQIFPLVIKADGLAFGKGVFIVEDISQAKDALRQMMEAKIHGNAGRQVVIEEYLNGREISIHAFCDGKTSITFPSSQDHKRIGENDEGPNTGGMGTISPVPWVTDALMEEIEVKIIKPTLDGLRKRGREFVGVLFPGIMITDDGVKVIEFNARFGDPETQSYMPLLETDLLEILLASTETRLDSFDIKWKSTTAACIVLASGGYPGKYKTGFPIEGLEEAEENRSIVFHAGTKKIGDKTVTNGGRVLNVVATGNGMKETLNRAYESIGLISFEGMQFRRDIGKKSLSS